MDISRIPTAINYAVVQPPGLTQHAAGEFQADAPARFAGGGGTTLLQNINWYDRKGFQTDYSARDAAASLFKREYGTFNLFDQASLTRHVQWMQNRFAAEGTLSVDPTEREVDDYLDKLRREGLDGEVDWSGIAQEFKAFQATSPEELSDGVDYLASRCVAVLDKLERNFDGEALAARKARLEEVCQSGVSGLTEGYTRLLQENLGVCDADARDIRNSLSAVLEQRVRDYRGAVDAVSRAVAETGADAVWLKNCDAYLAAQLRKTGAGQGSAGAVYSLPDLTAAGQIAALYQSETVSVASRDEAEFALRLGMADMKAEKLISSGKAGEKMALLLRASRESGHSAVLDAADRYLAMREANRGQYAAKGTYAPMDRDMFRRIYSAVMDDFRRSGDAASAIRAGASAGKALTETANRKNPQVLRWGSGMKAYWQSFYTAPRRRGDPLRQQAGRLLQQANLPDKSLNSTYQNFVNDWQSFLDSTGGCETGMDVTA